VTRVEPEPIPEPIPEPAIYTEAPPSQRVGYSIFGR
jgi:hypothetical protein